MLADSYQHPWPDAPNHPLFEGSEVHVWRAFLRRDHSTVQFFSPTLSSDEQRRADRFHFERDRDCFVLARGILREIIGRYVNLAPARVRFSYNSFGKPYVSYWTDKGRLRFNVSYTHDAALYVIALGREVGIDIEFVREDIASLDLAERFFSSTEVSMFRTLSPKQHTAAFFNCWTRKEAYIKGIGEGLSHPLDSFTVSLLPGDPAELLTVGGSAVEATRWRLLDLFPAEGYVGALAVEREQPVATCWQWSSKS